MRAGIVTATPENKRIATTTLLIIRSPFGGRTGAHFNPAVTLTFFWLGRGHPWDATC
jgi:aquaporin Z